MLNSLSKIHVAIENRVLHPAFEEDEILLILVGGVLGLFAGAIQVAAFY